MASSDNIAVQLLQLAQIVEATDSEGPGRRFAAWVQGCPLCCPGCCNPEMLGFSGGWSISVSDLTVRLQRAVLSHRVEGVTLLGGEPFAQAEGLAEFARLVRAEGLSVMVFSGYLLEQIRRRGDAAEEQLLAHADILVDGPYRRDLPETRRRWIGSTNQRIHFLSDRYRPDDACWQQPNSVEFRLRGNEVTVNGFPIPPAARAWRRGRAGDSSTSGR